MEVRQIVEAWRCFIPPWTARCPPSASIKAEVRSGGDDLERVALVIPRRAAAVNEIGTHPQGRVTALVAVRRVVTAEVQVRHLFSRSRKWIGVGKKAAGTRVKSRLLELEER